MAATTSHQSLRYPTSADLAKPRIDVANLAADVDAKMPKITQGSGAPPSTGVRAGDVHLQYAAGA
jgi:hypothetical protein